MTTTRLAPGHLSALQRRILVELADLMVNSCDPLLHDPDGECKAGCHGVAKVNELRNYCGDYWQVKPDVLFEKQRRAAVSSFSRSLRTLFDKDLISAVVLAWVLVTKDDHEDIWGWQGGGRRNHLGLGPRNFKMVTLTEAGWYVARRLLVEAA